MAGVESYGTGAGVRYMVRYRKPGGGTTTKRGFRRKLDANRWAVEKESSKNRGEFVDEEAGKVTVAELEPAWMAKKRTSCKPSYMYSLDISWKTHVAATWGARQVKSLGHSEIQEWVVGLAGRRSPTVTLCAAGILAGILDDAVRDRRMARNPARGLELPRKQRRAHVYLRGAVVRVVGCVSGW